MNIKKYIKECYEIAKSKGFYPEDSKIEDHLMGIVSEIGEAYEAHRGGKFAFKETSGIDISSLMLDENKQSFLVWYNRFVKDTFEDELADVFIRLFNLIAHLNLNITSIKDKSSIDYAIWSNTSLSGILTLTVRVIGDIQKPDSKIIERLVSAFGYLMIIARFLNIPIEKHIQAKIEYNRTRPYLHNKEY